MERNQRDKGGQFDQKQQRDKLHGGSKGDVDEEKTRRGSEQQKQGSGQQGGGQGFERDLPRRGNEDFDVEQQGGTSPGRRSEQGTGQTGSPRQTGVGEPGRTGSGSPGQRSI